MGYESIQIGDPSSFAKTILEARRLSQEQERNRWEQVAEQGRGGRDQQRIGMEQVAQTDRLAQQHQDYIAQYTQKAMDMAEAGMPLQAQAYAALHNIPFALPTAQPGAAPQAPGAPQQPQAQPPAEQPNAQPQQAQAPQGPPPQQAPAAPVYQGGGIAGLNVDAAAQGVANAGHAGLAGPDQSPPWTPPLPGELPPQQAPAPAQAAQPPQQAQGARYTIQTPRGPVEVDPMEARNAELARNAERADLFKKSFTGVPMMGSYAEPGAALIRSGEDIKGSDILGLAKADSAARLKAQEDAAKAAEELRSKASVAQQDEWHRLDAKARVAAGAGSNRDLKNDTGNRQDMGALRSEFKQWRDRNQLNIDSKSSKRLNTIVANLDSGNAMQQREGAESLVSVFKGGGQVTKASQDLLLKHLSGLVGDAQTFLQHLESGHYGQQELSVMQQAAKAAVEEQRNNLKLNYESAVADFGPGSGWENLGANVDHMVQSEFKQFDIDAPPIYGSHAPGVSLGSGKRPTPSKTPGAPHADKPAALSGPGGKTLTLGPDGLYH